MRELILIISISTLVLAEHYREKEDFAYSRSSTDEGSKSGYYGAQRGNMGGNYERAHNMDGLAQHQMSGLVKQVEGELGDTSKANVGSVYSAANSRGIYGTGNYDLSNLEGRNFQEGESYGGRQSSLSRNSYNGYSSSAQRSNGFSSSQSENSRYMHQESGSSQSRQSTNRGYDYGQDLSNNYRQNFQQGYQRNAVYDKNLANNQDTGVYTRLISTVPARVIIRPGSTVNVPVGVQTFDTDQQQSSSTYDRNSVNSEAEALSSSDHQSSPTNNAKHYESKYRYHKEWEKHNSYPVGAVPLAVPETNTYNDRQRFNTQHESNGLDSHRENSANTYSASNSNSASSSQSRYQTEYNTDREALGYNTNSDHNSAASLDKDSQSTNVDFKPKSYQSSYSYHKSWERQGDPYVIEPSSKGKISQKLSSLSKDQAGYNSQSGTNYELHQSYPIGCNIGCDENGHIRVYRSVDEKDNQNQNIYENQENLGQQTQNRFDRLEDMGQQTQNNWGGVEDLGQQTQNNWGDSEVLGQQIQNNWDGSENVGQQTQNNWGDSQDLGQQTQNNWDGSENFGQQTQDNWGPSGNSEQQIQGEWRGPSHSEDLGQQTQNAWNKIEVLGQQNVDLGQETQNEWDKRENFGQQTQNSDLSQHTQNTWDKIAGFQKNSQNNDFDQQTQDSWDLGQQAQDKWDTSRDLGPQIQDNWSNLEYLRKETEDKWNNAGDLTQSRQDKRNKTNELQQLTNDKSSEIETQNETSNFHAFNQQIQSTHFEKISNTTQKNDEIENKLKLENSRQHSEENLNISENIGQQIRKLWNSTEQNQQTQQQIFKNPGQQPTQNIWNYSDGYIQVKPVWEDIEDTPKESQASEANEKLYSQDVFSIYGQQNEAFSQQSETSYESSTWNIPEYPGTVWHTNVNEQSISNDNKSKYTGSLLGAQDVQSSWNRTNMFENEPQIISNLTQNQNLQGIVISQETNYINRSDVLHPNYDLHESNQSKYETGLYDDSDTKIIDAGRGDISESDSLSTNTFSSTERSKTLENQSNFYVGMIAENNKSPQETVSLKESSQDLNDINSYNNKEIQSDLSVIGIQDALQKEQKHEQKMVAHTWTINKSDQVNTHVEQAPRELEEQNTEQFEQKILNLDQQSPISGFEYFGQEAQSVWDPNESFQQQAATQNFEEFPISYNANQNFYEQKYVKTNSNDHDMDKLQSSPKHEENIGVTPTTDIATTTEVTENPGWWKQLGNKISSAKNKVIGWFKT